MADTTIRTLLAEDVPAVLAIWGCVLPRDPMDEARFVRMVLADPDYRPGPDSGFFVATRNGQPVGFLRAIIRHWPNDRLGLEPDDAWVPVLAVDPVHQRTGVGTALLDAALEFAARYARKRVWVCGAPTSAPGSIVPGVDTEAYPGALPLFQKRGFTVDQYGFSMTRSLIDFDEDAFREQAWETGTDVEVGPLTPVRVHDFFGFLAEALPGAWTIAGRAKVQTGRLHEILIASAQDRVIGYCQWDGEHFGPFGVAPAARNKRVGAKLFVESLRRIRQAGGRTVWFNWADENAKRFYDRFGLRVTRSFAVLRKDL